MRRDYELGIIFNPEVSEEQTRAVLERVEQVVANYGGQAVKVQQWGRRRMAYPIERHRDGFYVFIDMILTPETVSEIERTLKVSEIVLRHMMRRRDPKAVQQERQEREARAAAAALAASQAPAPVATEEGTETETAAQPAAETEELVPTRVEELVPTETEELVPAEAAAQETPEVPTEDFGDVPPAIEEETVEA